MSNFISIKWDRFLNESREVPPSLVRATSEYTNDLNEIQMLENELLNEVQLNPIKWFKKGKEMLGVFKNAAAVKALVTWTDAVKKIKDTEITVRDFTKKHIPSKYHNILLPVLLAALWAVGGKKVAGSLAEAGGDLSMGILVPLVEDLLALIPKLLKYAEMGASLIGEEANETPT
tara:strand:- start:227 stop:751 length:525 start_codon:yes stop_codon:yes gene_type:complete